MAREGLPYLLRPEDPLGPRFAVMRTGVLASMMLWLRDSPTSAIVRRVLMSLRHGHRRYSHTKVESSKELERRDRTRSWPWCPAGAQHCYSNRHKASFCPFRR